MVKDDLCAALDFVEKGGPETGIGELIKFRDFVQSTAGELRRGLPCAFQSILPCASRLNLLEFNQV